MGYYSSTPDACVFAGMIIGMLLVWLLAMAFSVTMYVLQSLGIYTIAKRRCIRSPWLAWVPVANMWIWGSLSDQYQYLVKRKQTNRRVILTVLSILTTIAGCLMIGFYINFIVQMITNAGVMDTMTDTQAMQIILQPMLAMLGALMLLGILSLVNAIFLYMALYDIFASLEPANATLYLVLSILFNITQPFFLFCNRKKDGGMPPRRAQYDLPTA